MEDRPIHFHASISNILDTFKMSILSIGWLQASHKSISLYFQKYPYMFTLACSVTDDEVKIDKSLLKFIEKPQFDKSIPVLSAALINLYRIFVIAVKDLIWEHDDFLRFRKSKEMQFLRHIRNGCAHNNQFYWGKGKERERTIKNLPIIWRGKKIDENLENTKVFFNFLAPGDIFVLLEDISKLSQGK